MNALNRRITLLFAVINLVVAGVLPAQDVSDEQINRALATRQAEVARKQAEAAQKQAGQVEVERSQALVDVLIAQGVGAPPPEIPAAPAAPTPPSISFNRAWSSRPGGAGSVLVIPSAEIKAEDVVAIAEDMNVMSRIFEKNLEQARIATARGGLFAGSRDPLVAFLGGGGAIESMYLQGCGALFLMKVDFPLSAPPQVEEEKQAEQKAESDPVWEQMRREMYEPQEVGRGSQKEPEEKYDAGKVESLKITLIKALKHTANIRSLKPDESVILTVTGSGESAGARVAAIHGRSVLLSHRNQVVVQEKSGDGTAKTKIVEAPSSSQTPYFSPTALVIRAKKSDIDEFAKGTLDADQFRQRAQVLACPYLGGEAGHGDPFNIGTWRSVQYR
jgi:hypothetical protein